MKLHTTLPPICNIRYLRFGMDNMDMQVDEDAMIEAEEVAAVDDYAADVEFQAVQQMEYGEMRQEEAFVEDTLVNQQYLADQYALQQDNFAQQEIIGAEIAYQEVSTPSIQPQIAYNPIYQEVVVDNYLPDRQAQMVQQEAIAAQENILPYQALRQEQNLVMENEMRQEQLRFQARQQEEAVAYDMGEIAIAERENRLLQEQNERRRVEEQRANELRNLEQAEIIQTEMRVDNQLLMPQEENRFLREEERVQEQNQFQRLAQKEQIVEKIKEAQVDQALVNTAPNRFESPVYYHHFFEWKEGLGWLSGADITIGDKDLKLSDLGKIKVMKETATNGSRKIKLTHLTGDILYSVQADKMYGDVPLHYYWFAHIVTEKLHLKGCDFTNPYVPERRFTNLNAKNPLIDGILYKQSQYLKTWELRYVAITNEGLHSYKDENGGESFTIKRDTATELWTRFDIHERMLVIKVHHNGRKTEFGIPIVDYLRESGINWLYPFYKLIFPS